jgi:predicted Zn finger-like uncharacterized protein
MLLTCPECSVKYNVADGAIPPKGRSVRCAACGHSWFQMPDGVTKASQKPGETIKKDNFNNGLRVRPKPLPQPPEEPHAKMRKKVLDKIELGNRLAAGLPWGLAALVAVTIGVTAISYRTDIVRAWPKSASAFASIGQPANLYGVDIRSITAQAGMDAKGPRVTVRGVLASVSRKSEPVAYLKISLVDAKGIEKLSWMVDPGVTVLHPGKSHTFESSRSNPVRGDLKTIVTFAEPPPLAPRPPPPPPEPPTGKSGLMGAKPGNTGQASHSGTAHDSTATATPVTSR